jgi:hypothetical protein
LSSTDNNNSIQSTHPAQKEIEERLEQRRRQQEEKKQEQQQQQSTLKPVVVAENENNNDKGRFFDKKLYPGFSQDELNRYLSTKKGERQKYIAEHLARQTKFIIPLFNNSASTDSLDDPTKPFTKQDADETRNISIEQAEYQFHDVAVKHWNILQGLDYDLSQAINEIQYSVWNIKGGLPPDEFAALSNKLKKAEETKYRYGARVFLRMSDDEWNRVANHQTVKDIVDACIHRTTTTIPNYSKISNEHFT